MAKPSIKNIALITGLASALTACASGPGYGEGGQGGPRMRAHTATSAGEIVTIQANHTVGQSQITIDEIDGQRRITANGLPSHLVGQFPNSGNPNRIQAQNHRFTMPLSPTLAPHPIDLSLRWIFGIATNGVVIDPLAAEFWQGDRNSGWNYDALSGAVPLGVDSNHAHVQPDGTYHYHGLPTGLMERSGWQPGSHSPLIGWAADGFAIYALTGNIDGTFRELRSGYQLKPGARPGGNQPDGAYDGAFLEDYQFVEGSGDLDRCNGAVTRSNEHPNGSYAYFITNDFPVIPRCFAGNPDQSFQKDRPNRRQGRDGRNRPRP